MTDSWTGVVVGPFTLTVAAPLVIGHYRHECGSGCSGEWIIATAGT